MAAIVPAEHFILSLSTVEANDATESEFADQRLAIGGEVPRSKNVECHRAVTACLSHALDSLDDSFRPYETADEEKPERLPRCRRHLRYRSDRLDACLGHHFEPPRRADRNQITDVGCDTE
jgi:hypothetical protein